MTEPDRLAEILTGEDKEKKYLGLERERMYLQSGWFGRVFGSPQAAPGNIIGFVAVILVCAVGFVMLCGPSESLDHLEVVAPVLTGILGFLFGRRPDAA